MDDALVADRFVRTRPGAWLDIATGDVMAIASDAACGDELDRQQKEVHAIDARHAAELHRVVDAIVRAADVRASTGMRGLHVASALPIGSVIDAAARALRPLGFVTVRAVVDLPLQVRRHLLHRHVVLVTGHLESVSSLDLRKTTDWIRDLSHVSTRAHLAVLLGDCVAWAPSSRSPGAGMVREAEATLKGDHPSRRTALLLSRSTLLTRRGRHAAAERWARAAVQAARRRGEVATERTAATGLVERLMGGGDWDGATAAGLRELRRVRDWPSRQVLAAVTARALIGSADLARAETLLQSISVEAAARREAVADEVRLRLSQLHFWQGRFEEAASGLLEHPGPSAEWTGWRALTRWASGSAGALEEARRHLNRGCLSTAIDLELAFEPTPAAGPQRPSHGVAARQRGSPIERALVAWIDARRSGASSARQAEATAQWIRARGARGIFRWGRGRGAMSLLHDVTALLQLVHETDDEGVALQRSCDWVRQHIPSESAAVVSAHPIRLIAGCGWTDKDLRDEALQSAIDSRSPRTLASDSQTTCLSPMRYGGATIGCAIVRGDRARSATLAEGALALASACAPALRARLDALACAAAGQSLAAQILGHSPSMLALREAIARAAVTSFPVLVEGESGTGKELVARAVHRLSARRDRAFSALNCAALTDELAEAELFGHARGAFTGAMNARAGLFEEAHGGTMFLDEVSELSARAQAKLLRVLQEREVRRVGEHAARPIDVRVVAATNVPLADAVARDRFREDLLFRLAVIRVRVPPLRDRIEDVPVLAQAFWRAFLSQTPKRAVLGPDAIARLCRHRWPGNVRELQNVIAALVVGAPSRGRVAARHVERLFTEVTPGAVPAVSLDQARETLERQMVAAALARHAGGRSRAARDLGLSRQGLGKVMKRLGLESDRRHDAGAQRREEDDRSRVARTG